MTDYKDLKSIIESVMRLEIHCSINKNYSIGKLKDNQYLMQEYNWFDLIKIEPFCQN